MGMGVKPGRKRIQTLLQRSKLPLEGAWRVNNQTIREGVESPSLQGLSSCGQVAAGAMG